MSHAQKFQAERHKFSLDSPDDIDWVVGQTPLEAIVRGTRGIELFLAAKGPARSPEQPVVILEAGMGASSSCWGPVQRLLEAHMRCYCYDRAGYGRSPPATSPRTGSIMAGELLDVLSSTRVKPPYVLVAHSFGGIVAREFVAMAGPGAVVGMVLVDAIQENTIKILQEPLRLLGSLAGPKIFALLDATGLLAGKDYYTADELYQLTLDAEKEAKVTTKAAEMALMSESSHSLMQKRQFENMALGMHPVTVIQGDTKRDYQRVITAIQHSGIHGDASQQLAGLSNFIETDFEALHRQLQRQQLLLSANSRYVQALCSGHAVIATEPQVVADEILSVWESCLDSDFDPVT